MNDDAMHADPQLERYVPARDSAGVPPCWRSWSCVCWRGFSPSTGTRPIRWCRSGGAPKRSRTVSSSIPIFLYLLWRDRDASRRDRAEALLPGAARRRGDWARSGSSATGSASSSRRSVRDDGDGPVRRVGRAGHASVEGPALSARVPVLCGPLRRIPRAAAHGLDRRFRGGRDQACPACRSSAKAIS